MWSYEMMVRPSSWHVMKLPFIGIDVARYQKDNLTRWKILQKSMALGLDYCGMSYRNTRTVKLKRMKKCKSRQLRYVAT